MALTGRSRKRTCSVPPYHGMTLIPQANVSSMLRMVKGGHWWPMERYLKEPHFCMLCSYHPILLRSRGGSYHNTCFSSYTNIWGIYYDI